MQAYRRLLVLHLNLLLGRGPASGAHWRQLLRRLLLQFPGLMGTRHVLGSASLHAQVLCCLTAACCLLPAACCLPDCCGCCSC